MQKKLVKGIVKLVIGSGSFSSFYKIFYLYNVLFHARDIQCKFSNFNRFYHGDFAVYSEKCSLEKFITL